MTTVTTDMIVSMLTRAAITAETVSTMRAQPCRLTVRNASTEATTDHTKPTTPMPTRIPCASPRVNWPSLPSWKLSMKVSAPDRAASNTHPTPASAQPTQVSTAAAVTVPGRLSVLAAKGCDGGAPWAAAAYVRLLVLLGTAAAGVPPAGAATRSCGTP